MKKLLAAAALAATIVGFAGPVPAQAKAFTELKFGVDATYPPFESLSPSGQFVGFDMDLGRAICDYLKVKCVFVSQTFSGIIPALEARKFDAILSSMSKTAEREKAVSFSSQMYDEPTSLIAKKGSGITATVDGLKGKAVGVEAGTIQESYANAYWKPFGVKVVSYPGQDQVYADLLTGRLDASLQDSVEADYGFLKTPKGADYMLVANITDDPKAVLGSYVAIGVRKNEEALLAKIDEAIAAMHKDGTYDKLQSKYFNFNIYQASAN
ncbi:transporter substrate-binding domain-containing protein [Acidisoma cladoniae]|jgi:lysine/arginine/ornithine transport system substrate-binding protein|uniref:transporter substrate-binding domain-containing protein n=1 Tax=Acidisoma cladoniae TaxID=3040935 RepID=UPI0025501C5E|nr:transporter substrate-binding domain-containing protein [Acidisoma sp. PAMC 29798]